MYKSVFIGLGVSLLVIPSVGAQEVPGCFMVNPSGQTINLSDACTPPPPVIPPTPPAQASAGNNPNNQKPPAAGPSTTNSTGGLSAPEAPPPETSRTEDPTSYRDVLRDNLRLFPRTPGSN